ncbi:hypothetical protein JCM11641_007806 [Rhodosporidiobolus odoratus]
MSDTLTARLLHFRDSLNAASPPSTFSSFFISTTPGRSLPCCIEHGPPDHPDLPFLGKPFTGQQAIEKYYSLISSILKGKGSTFNEDSLLVKLKEEETRARAVWTGTAVWSVQKTGKEWEEAVVWAFDAVKAVEGANGQEEWKIEKWEVWADPLSAYLAS